MVPGPDRTRSDPRHYDSSMTSRRPKVLPRRGLREDAGCEEDASGAIFHRIVAWALLIGGRVLSLATIAVVTWSWRTKGVWSSAPLDNEGFTTAELPNLAMVMVFCLGMALPFIILPIGSTALAVRSGSTVIVRTVLGRRTIDLTTARLWRAILPGRGVNTHLVVIRSRWRWAALAASGSWDDTDFRILGEFNEESDRSGWHGERRLALRGWGLLILSVLLAFILLGVGGGVVGIF